MRGLSKLAGRLEDFARQSRDSFENSIALGTANRGDLGSHFRYDPEAYRLYRNGERVFLIYDEDFKATGATTHFDDNEDTYTLSPAPGDNMTFTTAERFRYVVMYESEFSLAWETNRPLEDDESVSIIFDGSEPKQFGVDGHGIIYSGGDTDQTIIRDGQDIVRDAAHAPRSPDRWSIYQNVFNWYNVGRKKGTEWFGDGKSQRSVDLGTVITDGQRGPRVGNGRITIQVNAGTRDDLEVKVGSMGFRNLGQTTPKTRGKGFPIETEITIAGEYEPIAAVRVNPADFLVTTDVLNIAPVNTQGATDFVTIAVDESKTDATGFETPPEANTLASSVQATTNISTLPDATGAVVASATNPGGYQLAYGNTEVSGGGQGQVNASLTRERRQRLHDTDIGIVCAKTQTTGSAKITVFTEQEK